MLPIPPAWGCMVKLSSGGEVQAVLLDPPGGLAQREARVLVLRCTGHWPANCPQRCMHNLLSGMQALALPS